ncbi:glycine--tRNA ligase subunit beta [cyanobiont of Ornithocercus magnificus]|nr:glycine--tRNA ligase subunit beta [cyanobiont of Ornithocercus magnificus]
MSSTFLLEIGTEELPADFVRQALVQLNNSITRDLGQLCLSHGAVLTGGTPRRLVIRVKDLADMQQDRREERKGPLASQAFKDGVPGPAAIGFARSCGIEPRDLELRDTPRGMCVFASTLIKGYPTANLLSTLIPKWIRGIQGDRFMRWGAGKQRFSRPIRWLLSLFGTEVVPVQLKGTDPEVIADRISRGHRLHDDYIVVSSADEHAGLLNAAGVIIDRADRAERIRQGIYVAASAVNGEPDCPKSLLQELTDLVESPQIISGTISDKFLDLPPEVITTVMQSHQRYIPLRAPNAPTSLLLLGSREVMHPTFLMISNGLAESSDNVRHGNERVLTARLADAEFFLAQDRQQSSADRREALASVTFAEGLGNLRDRCDRIEWLTDLLTQHLKLSIADTESARRAAYLCKHDLVSRMVSEFPELQGLIGGKYLIEEGESSEVALAVIEHYLPRGAGDALPGSNAGAVVALAERLELLLSILSKGERPSGSSDPYALRRAGNGLLQILWSRNWQVDLNKILEEAIQHWKSLFSTFNLNTGTLKVDLSLLIRQRLVLQLEDEGFDLDLIQAVAGEQIAIDGLLANPSDVRQRLVLLAAFRRDGRLKTIQATVQRASRLAAKGDLPDKTIDPSLVVQPAQFESLSEQALLDQLQALQPSALKRDYISLAQGLQSTAIILSSFLDGNSSVMVMAKDPDIRRNRLNLLSVLRNQATVLADFDVIQG